MDDWTEDLDAMERKVTRDGGRAGTLLAGRYLVTRPLGQGGMGSVWLAEDEKLDNHPVAVKMLPSILVANKRAYNQLKSEALVAMKLSHPNIVTLRAFEEDNGNPFLVMDYVPGQTLEDLLAEKGTLTEAEAISLLAPVAAALDYAHGKRVVHRDVKPGNVMVAKDGTPFVMDFGIAREAQETLTRVTGRQSSGTLSYMSPEQLNGAAPKAPQDVYSFAAMVYECLTGNPPFFRGQIEYQIVNNPPEPLPEGIGIAASVMAGLAKRPEERPASCAAVLGLAAGSATAPVKGPRSVGAAPPPSRPASVRNAVTEEDAARARVEAKIRKMRIEQIPDEDGFAERKKDLNELFLKAEMFFESRLWSDAKSQFAEYAENCEALTKLDGERRTAKANRSEAETTKTMTLPGGAQMRFRWCPPGTFTMGSPASEEGRYDNETQHCVILTNGFWMGETPVTQKQWKSVMGNNPSHFTGGLFSGGSLPVEEVSWNDCQIFIQKVKAALNCGVRLPTEAEWEYACRAGTTGAYGGSGKLDEMGWYRGNSGDKTHPVGQKKPNDWGLYDMHGNVWEWCADWWGEYPSQSVIDPTGPSTGSRRVLRGGGWYDRARNCRSAARGRLDPDYRGNYYVGFRLLCSAGPHD